MPILRIYIDEITMERLEKAACIEGRQPDELASCAVEEAVLEYVKRNGMLVLVPAPTYNMCGCGLETKQRCNDIGCPKK